MQDRAENSDASFSLFSGGTAHGCTEDDDYDVDDVEVLQLVSLIDSRRRPEGSSGARCKTTGARAESRAVGTTQPLAPEVSFGHLGHRVDFADAVKLELGQLLLSPPPHISRMIAPVV